MTLLDRFRTQPPQKHPDASVRLSYVEELPLADRDTIAAMAREDDDPRVRRAAVAKLMDPVALAQIASTDRDDTVRARATTMLRDIALEAFEDAGEATSLEAVEVISDVRTLAQIAKQSIREAVGLRALSGLEEGKLLGSVARHAVVESVRRAALQALVARPDPAEILAVALNSDFKDTAVDAVETIHDRAALDQIIARGKNKSAVKRARSVVREADEQTALTAAEAAAAAEVMVSGDDETLVPQEATPPHGDPLADAAEPAGVTEVVTPPEVEPGQEAIDPAGAEQAHVAEDEPRPQVEAAAAEQREREAEAARIEAERRTARLPLLVEESAVAIAEPDLASARKRFTVLRREWRELGVNFAVDPELAARFAELETQMATRESEAREADARARREALARVNNLVGRVEPLAANAEISLKAAERALREVRTALGAMPQLPTKQDYDEAMRRLKAVQGSLTTKVQELREADDWKRFGNVAVQEQLCARMEALKAVEDPEAIALEVRELQQQWRAAADVPRAQADALWRRFKTAHDEVWPRVEAHFAVRAQERAENLAKKVALCERAEGLAESTNWIQTADEIKTLQAEWKTIGPVSRGREKAIWDRFRAACDRFFTRRHEDLAQRKATWAENLARKEALSVRAEALAQSTDWDQAAAEIKQLQAEWKTVGPVKKSKSEAIWQRFRGACDAFFARYAQRHDTARAERIGAREAICAELEALAPLPQDLNAAAAPQSSPSPEATAPQATPASELTVASAPGAPSGSPEGAIVESSGAEDAGAPLIYPDPASTSVQAEAEPDAPPENLTATVRTLRGRWQQEIAARGVDPERARVLDARFTAALNRVMARWPAAFAGTDLDPSANRKRMEALVKRVEELAASIAGPAAAADASLSPTNRLAAMLKEALAANTIGGKVEDDSRLRAAAEDVRQAQAAWARIGLVPDDARRPLADRFQRAVRRINDKLNAANANKPVPVGAGGPNRGGGGHGRGPR
jgi:hypothetical protein